ETGSYSSVLGMDFSSVSIASASRLPLENASFICADIHTFVPKKTFDVIVFNEVFYYIHDSEKQRVLDRMVDSLNAHGIIVTSLYREGSDCWKYFDRNMTQLHFVTITTDNDKTYWKIGVYKK